MRKRIQDIKPRKRWNEADRVRKHIREIGVTHLKPQDQQILNNKYAIITSVNKPNPGWKYILDNEPDSEFFTEINLGKQGTRGLEILVRVLASYNEKDQIVYESVQWYPAEDLRTRPEKTIELRQTSSLSIAQVPTYFTDPKLLEQWFSGGDAYCVYNPEKNLMSISVGQDHYLEWHYRDISRDHIEMQQIWLDDDTSHISIQLTEMNGGTEIVISIHGRMSIYLERDYLSDWNGIHHIP